MVQEGILTLSIIYFLNKRTNNGGFTPGMKDPTVPGNYLKSLRYYPSMGNVIKGDNFIRY